MTARSGQVTVATAGTAVQGTSIPGPEFALTAHPDNTGVVYVGNDGANDVTSANGYALGTAEGMVVVRAANLNELWFDAATNGDIVCWLKTR
jgi:hypothetical protein